MDLRGLVVDEPWTSTYFTINAMDDATLRSFHTSLEFIKAVGGHEMVVAELGGAVHPLPVAVFANKPTFTDEQWDALCRGLNQHRQDRRRRGDALCPTTTTWAPA